MNNKWISKQKQSKLSSLPILSGVLHILISVVDVCLKALGLWPWPRRSRPWPWGMMPWTWDFGLDYITDLYLERSQSVQYFSQQFSYATRKCCRALWVKQKSEQVPQANVFKRHTLMFHFSTYRPNSFKHLSHRMPVSPREGIDRCARCIGRRNNTAARFFLINNTFSTISKLFTPNMYCCTCKILVTIYWTHLRLNGICAKSFCPQQTNNRRLFLVGWFQRQWCHI